MRVRGRGGCLLLAAFSVISLMGARESRGGERGLRCCKEGEIR